MVNSFLFSAYSLYHSGSCSMLVLCISVNTSLFLSKVSDRGDNFRLYMIEEAMDLLLINVKCGSIVKSLWRYKYCVPEFLYFLSKRCYVFGPCKTQVCLQTI